MFFQICDRGKGSTPMNHEKRNQVLRSSVFRQVGDNDSKLKLRPLQIERRRDGLSKEIPFAARPNEGHQQRRSEEAHAEHGFVELSDMRPGDGSAGDSLVDCVVVAVVCHYTIYVYIYKRLKNETSI